MLCATRSGYGVDRNKVGERTVWTCSPKWTAYRGKSNREAFIKHSKTIHDQLSFVQENKLYSCYRFRLCKKYYELFPSAFVLKPYKDMVFYFLKLYFALKNYQLDRSLNVKMGSITKPLIKGIHFIRHYRYPWESFSQSLSMDFDGYLQKVL